MGKYIDRMEILKLGICIIILLCTMQYASALTCNSSVGGHNLSDSAENIVRISFSNDVLDTSGNARTTANKNVTFTTDKAGNANSAGVFDGITSSLNITDINIPLTQYKSWSFWFNAKNTAYTLNNVYHEPTYLSNYTLFRINNNVLRYDFNQKGGRNLYYPFTDSNTWSFVVLTYNNSDLRMYLNNVLVNSSVIGSTEYLENKNVTYVGGYFGTSQYFNGTIDEFNRWNHALNESEINQLYQGYDNYSWSNCTSYSSEPPETPPPSTPPPTEEEAALSGNIEVGLLWVGMILIWIALLFCGFIFVPELLVIDGIYGIFIGVAIFMTYSWLALVFVALNALLMIMGFTIGNKY